MRRILLLLLLFPIVSSCAHLQSGSRVIKKNDYTCYQIKDVRVYFSYTFMFGLMCHGDSVELAKKISKMYYARIEPLFKYNLINGEMFFNQWAERKRAESQPVINQSNYPPKGDITINDELLNYKGRIIKIFRFSEYEYDSIASPNKCRFYICCTPSIDEDGWGAQDMFLVELEARRNLKLFKNWDDMIKHSKINTFKYCGFEL